MYIRYNQIAMDMASKGKINLDYWTDKNKIESGHGRTTGSRMKYFDDDIERDDVLKRLFRKIKSQYLAIGYNYDSSVRTELENILKSSEKDALRDDPYHPGIWTRLSTY